MDDVSIECWGPTALLVRFADTASSHSLARCRGLLTALNAAKLPPGTELVPGYGEIMIDLSDTTALAEARRVTQEAVSKARPVPADGTRLHRIPVHYDGPDLIEFADQSGLAAAEVIELHSRPVYDVFLVGFAPGFAYLGPLDSRLHRVRKSTPRPRVEAGSIGIGGSHTGIYSIASPGGWWLLGKTAVTVFDPERNDATAFRFALGDRVKFEPAQ